jgi:hypothetical protein
LRDLKTRVRSVSKQVHIHDRLESDSALRALVEAEGLEPYAAILNLQVHSLRSCRALTLTIDPDESDLALSVIRTETSLTGDAVFDGYWREDFPPDGGERWIGDRLGIWDRGKGANLTTTVRVCFTQKPEETVPRKPLARTARICFNSDVFAPSEENRWFLLVPLPPAELEALCHAVENDRVGEVALTATVSDLFQRKRDFVPPVHEPTDYFALPKWFGTDGEPPDHAPPYRVGDMPCEWLRVSVQTGVPPSPRRVDRNEDHEARSPLESESPAATRHLVAIREVRDTLKVVAAALFLIAIALLIVGVA